MKTAILRHVTLLLVSALLAGCATMKSRADLFEQAQRDYAGAIRWGNFDVAYAMHRNADGTVPVPEARLNNYKVTSYLALTSKLSDDEKAADQVVEIKYYHKDYLSESTLTLQQHWRYDAPTHSWLITSAPPEFE